jgi:hypothetical protein
MLPPVKTEKEHGRWFNGWRSAKAAGSKGVQWFRDFGLSGASVNVVQTGINTPKPSRSTPNHAGNYGVDVAKTPSISTTSSSGLITTAGRPTENWGWQNVEDMQRDTVMRGLEQTINANRQSFSGMPQNPINYQTLWGEGARPGVQLPPITVNGIELNHAATKPPQHKHLQMAGFVPDGGYQRTLEISAKALQSIFAAFLPDMSDHPGAENPMDHIKRIITPESVDNFVKSAPKGAIMPLKGIFTLMLPDMSDIPGAEDPKAHFNRAFAHSLQKYDKLVHIQDPHSLSAQSGAFFGEMFAFGALGKVIRVAEGISVLGMACEGGMVGLVVSEAHDTNKVAGVAFGFIGGAAFARLSSRSQNPLVDRVFIRPQGYSRELRFLRSVNQPAYRSGIGNPMNEMVAVQPKALSKRVVTRLEALERKAINPINRSNNHSYVTFVENGQTQAVSMGDMSHAGTFHDRGGLTKAGRALDKHGQRVDTVFPKALGSVHEKNLQGQRILDEILNHPNKRIILDKAPRSKRLVIDIFHPNGHGARLSRNGKEFITFLEPSK